MISTTGTGPEQGPGPDRLLGETDILVFRYDIGEKRFLSLSGYERAFLGYSRREWLSADFLESLEHGEPEGRLQSSLEACVDGRRAAISSELEKADGDVVTVLLGAVPSEHHLGQINGQILVLDPRVRITWTG